MQFTEMRDEIQTAHDMQMADLVDDVKSFIGGAQRTDDITLLVLQRDLDKNPTD